MTRKVKVGLIGAGKIGRVHAQNLAVRIPEAELLAMSDLFLEATEKCAADFQLPTFTMIIAPSSRVREVNLFFPPMIMQLSYGACGVGKSVEGHPPHPPRHQRLLFCHVSKPTYGRSQSSNPSLNALEPKTRMKIARPGGSTKWGA